MAGKFANMITKRQAPAGDEEDHAPAPGAEQKKPGRPKKATLSKTDDPDYRLTSLRAHIDTIADADANLSKLRIGKDRSDLINHLVAKWNKNPEPF